jgi:hypothetical protein
LSEVLSATPIQNDWPRTNEAEPHHTNGKVHYS